VPIFIDRGAPLTILYDAVRFAAGNPRTPPIVLALALPAARIRA
jgi:hypothetical protein